MVCTAHFAGKYGSGIYTQAATVDPRTGRFGLNREARVKFTAGRFAR